MVSGGGDIVRRLKTMSLRTERTYETEMPAVQAPEKPSASKLCSRKRPAALHRLEDFE